MLGGVTRPMLPHLPGVPHLHANRLLISQSQISTCIFSPFDAFVIEQLEHLLRARVLRIFDTRKLMHEPIAHIRYIKILTWLRGFRASQNCKFFKIDSFVWQFLKETRAQRKPKKT